MTSFLKRLSGILGCLVLAVCQSIAWDYEIHRMINEIAVASLPTNFPAFVFEKTNKERIAFLGGEPDRWRNTPELELRHQNHPDHYFDYEYLEMHRILPQELPSFRYEFMAMLTLTRAAHPQNFPPIDPAKNKDKTRELPGFLPWTVNEYYAKLKSQFSCLKEFDENGSADEISNARQNAIYVMGVMGHFVGDVTQPLHTTKHFNGWVGENPNGYTTSTKIHSWIDGGYIEKVGINREKLLGRVTPAVNLRKGGNTENPDNLFPDIMKYFLEQNRLVETLYKMEKEGKFSGEGENGVHGREFIENQILKAGQMLGNLWLTAFEQASGDKFLKEQLLKKKAKNAE
ncbi:MAG: hypothetical protein N2487_02025 [Verrucomicrobiae bacterium]|nr:hypothetical protein [Verrucomicrobiae bacterium]